MLSVTKLGTGTGTVTFQPSGDVCGATCAVSAMPGPVVTREAQTANGDDSHFQGFTGGGCDTERDCQIM
jgi:hypothetical protein